MAAPSSIHRAMLPSAPPYNPMPPWNDRHRHTIRRQFHGGSILYRAIPIPIQTDAMERWEHAYHPTAMRLHRSCSHRHHHTITYHQTAMQWWNGDHWFFGWGGSNDGDSIAPSENEATIKSLIPSLTSRCWPVVIAIVVAAFHLFMKWLVDIFLFGLRSFFKSLH